MAQALGVLLGLADDFLLIDGATFAESEFSLLPWQLANRDAVEHLFHRTGIAEWCNRLGQPLLDRDGNPLGFGIRPLPGLLGARDVQMLVLAFGAPGAERAAPDAQHDLDTAVAAAVPVCREVLDHLEGQHGLPAALREEAEMHGRALIRVTRIAGQPLVRDASLRGNPQEIGELDDRIALVFIVANCLVLVGGAETQADLDGILMFDSDDVANLG